LKKLYTYIIFCLLTCGAISAQGVKFNSDDPMWMNNNGMAMATIYESYKDAIKKKEEAYKLSSINEIISKPALLVKLVNLQLLNLQNNNLTRLGPEFAALSSMYIMVSKKNPITYIDPAFAAQTRLLYLELYDTKLDSLPREMEQMGSLELLRIVGNTTDTLRISDSIKRMVNLKELLIMDANLHQFPSFICRSKKLESVSLINCKVDSIPFEIQWMENLKVLNLEGNNLKEIPYWIKYCKNLEVLILKNNKIDNFSEWIAHLPKLEFMDITENQLSLPDCDILRVLFKNRSAKVYSDYEKLMKERFGEQKKQ